MVMIIHYLVGGPWGDKPVGVERSQPRLSVPHTVISGNRITMGVAYYVNRHGRFVYSEVSAELPLQSVKWFDEPPVSVKYLRKLSHADLSACICPPYFAWQGVNSQRARREIKKRRAKGIWPWS